MRCYRLPNDDLICEVCDERPACWLAAARSGERFNYAYLIGAVEEIESDESLVCSRLVCCDMCYADVVKSLMELQGGK